MASRLKRNRLKDLEWFRPDGAEMSAGDWNVGYAKTLGSFLNGNAITERDSTGAPIIDDSFFLMFNSYARADGIQTADEKMGTEMVDRPRHCGSGDAE